MISFSKTIFDFIAFDNINLVMHSLYIQIKQFEDLCHLNQNPFFIFFNSSNSFTSHTHVECALMKKKVFSVCVQHSTINVNLIE